MARDLVIYMYMIRWRGGGERLGHLYVHYNVLVLYSFKCKLNLVRNHKYNDVRNAIALAEIALINYHMIVYTVVLL